MEEPSRNNVKQAKTHDLTKRLSVDIPVSVHLPFKTECSATRRQMVAELGDWVEAYMIGACK